MNRFQISDSRFQKYRLATVASIILHAVALVWLGLSHAPSVLEAPGPMVMWLKTEPQNSESRIQEPGDRESLTGLDAMVSSVKKQPSEMVDPPAVREKAPAEIEPESRESEVSIEAIEQVASGIDVEEELPSQAVPEEEPVSDNKISSDRPEKMTDSEAGQTEEETHADLEQGSLHGVGSEIKESITGLRQGFGRQASQQSSDYALRASTFAKAPAYAKASADKTVDRSTDRPITARLAFAGDPASLGIIMDEALSPDYVQAEPMVFPEPEYPTLSRRRGEEGRVVVKVEISAQGAVRRAQVESSSGFERLDQAALDAVKLARFTPALRNGAQVESGRMIAYRFELR